uniref:THAP-type domain-containing protein n=1 Tax=Macrostomum lignano TaxID=282301 RepID=A0A1I8H0J2_9PLAT
MPRKCSVVGCKSNYESERLATKASICFRRTRLSESDGKRPCRTS